MTSSSLVVVANRLPVRRGSDGSWEQSPGGLVSALAPCIEARKGRWIGWSGSAGGDAPPARQDGIEIEAIPLSRAEIQAYYEGCSNRSLWPLYHNAIRPSQYRRDWWTRYREVNERFAEAAARAAPYEGMVWVHDYQLQLVPAALRRRRPDLRVGFFLHIPFPPPDLFSQLPYRDEVLRGILGADVVGFQTEWAATNFRRTVLSSSSLASSSSQVEARGDDLIYEGRRIAVRVHGISIDVERYQGKSREPAVRARSAAVRANLGEPRNLLIGVDRLDYTKGIDLRLSAFQQMLRRRPDLVESTKLVQVAVPSREGVADYANQRMRVERLVAEINGEFGTIDRTPVYYVHHSLDLDELVALYAAADVMLVTPLCDGMNLVAKEFAVSNERDGVLVLSEFAGAAAELGPHSTIVNPWDPESMTAGLISALALPQDVRRARMEAMREVIRKRDVHHWAQDFLAELDGSRPVAPRLPAVRLTKTRSRPVPTARSAAGS